MAWIADVWRLPAWPAWQPHTVTFLTFTSSHWQIATNGRVIPEDVFELDRLH